MNRYRYIVREVCADESLGIPPREYLFSSLEQADRYAFRRVKVLNGIWRVSVCRFCLKEVSMVIGCKH